jgi:hypothetical protein
MIKAKVIETGEEFTLAQGTMLNSKSISFRVTDYIVTDL